MNMRPKQIFILIISGLVLGLSGCGGGTRDGNDTTERYYPLPDSSPGFKLKKPVLRGSLGVAAIDADGVRTDRRMLYTTADRPLELLLHHYRFWADSPTKMVQHKITDYLSKAGFAKKVTRFLPGAKVRYVLRGRLLKFERYVDTDKRQDAVLVSLELNVTNENTGNVVISNTVFNIRQKAVRAGNRNQTIVNSVAAFSKALDTALLQFVKQNAPKQFKKKSVKK